MQLHPEWQAILKRAWSIRLIILAGLLTAADAILQMIVGITAYSLVLTILSGLVSGAALIARIVAQKDLPNA